MALTPYEEHIYRDLQIPMPVKNKCDHEYGARASLPYKDTYIETCQKCGNHRIFEKDYR